MWPFKKRKDFFTEGEKQLIVEAIRACEIRTSGEIRLFVESKCRFMNAVDRAQEIFFQLQMDETEDRNAVLIYLATKDKQLAIFGDENIYKKLGAAYWPAEVESIIATFNTADYAQGLRKCIYDIGEALYLHFPFDHDTDKNELPDEIVFGK